jgi:uncharacterized membrane protein
MDERQNVTRLIRFVALFVAVPTISIGVVLALYSWHDHWMHTSGFLLLGAAAILAAVVAPKLAERWVPEGQ